MVVVSSDRGSWAGGVLLADTYLLGRRISRGGMGEVFEATHARLPGRFAVKILLPELTGHREAFARFCREAEVMSELRHPNVVQIFDFNTTPDGRPYFVMEFLEGRDLETRLNDTGPLALPFAVRIVDSVASALAAAHAHGIVHRDLKPANIFLVTVDGQPDELIKVLDFGISKVRAAGTLLSTPTDVLGTPPYMSPEQARGATHLIDGRTDQFALGAIAYRMLTGHDPFSGSDIASLLYQVVHQNPPPLARYVPATWDTRALQAVLDRAMAKDPGQRWPGMLEMARAFEAASEQTLSRLPAEGGAAVDLSATLIAAPPPPPGAEPAALTPTPVVRPLVPVAAARAVTPPPVSIAVEATAPALVTDEPPPIRTPGPVALPPAAAPAPAAHAPANTPLLREPAAAPASRYDWEPIGSIDEVPRQHRGLAAFGVVLGVAAVLLAVTGAYRRIPEIAAAVSRALHHRPAPAPTANEARPAAPTPPEPARTAPPQATTPPAAAPNATARERPAAPDVASDRPADRPRRERHHQPRTSGPDVADHPGSVELSPSSSPPSSADRSETRPVPARQRANPFLVAPSAPPPAAAPALAAPSAPPGFSIQPAAPTDDTSARDIAPPPGGDGDQPLPPSVR